MKVDARHPTRNAHESRRFLADDVGDRLPRRERGVVGGTDGGDVARRARRIEVVVEQRRRHLGGGLDLHARTRTEVLDDVVRDDGDRRDDRRRRHDLNEHARVETARHADGIVRQNAARAATERDAAAVGRAAGAVPDHVVHDHRVVARRRVARRTDEDAVGRDVVHLVAANHDVVGVEVGGNAARVGRGTRRTRRRTDRIDLAVFDDGVRRRHERNARAASVDLAVSDGDVAAAVHADSRARRRARRSQSGERDP